MNYKVIKDFQFTNAEKKIDVLKVGSILTMDPTSIEQYIFKKGNKEYLYDGDIIQNNPDFFEPVDWKNDLLVEIKRCKVKTPAVIFKAVTGYLDRYVFSKSILIPNEYKEILADSCFNRYQITGDKSYQSALKLLGYDNDQDKYWLKINQ